MLRLGERGITENAVKIDREGKPPVIIGARVTIGQALLSLLNGGVLLYNYRHPETPIPGEIAGLIAQPIIALAQVWWVNRYGVTT